MASLTQSLNPSASLNFQGASIVDRILRKSDLPFTRLLCSSRFREHFISPKRLGVQAFLKNNLESVSSSVYPTFSLDLNASVESSADVKSSSSFVAHLFQSFVVFIHQTRSILLRVFSEWKKPVVIALVFLSFVLSLPQMAHAAKGGGRMGGRSFSGRSSSSRTYSAPSHGSYSSPAYPSPMMSAPYYAPAPFFGGFSSPTIFIGRRGGNSLLGLFVFTISAFFLIKILTDYVGSSEGAASTSSVSIVRLQVGLLGLARTLQRDLERIAERADSSTSAGLHYILSETLLSLMRHPDYCVYARATSEVKKSEDEIESTFNRLSMEERGKFSEETLVNVGNIRRRVHRSPTADSFANEFIVVTVLVAVEGKLELPEVKSGNDLKESLALLGSFAEDRIQAVEILWTPQNEEDTLTEREMLQDYPKLNIL